MAIVISTLALKNGRTVEVDSAEFREKLPITAEMLDRIGGTEDIWEALSALTTAVLAIEARGVQFDD